MKIRHQQVAGYFYPAEKDKLQKDISSLLQSAKTEKSFNKIFGIVSPHAGYIYSGKTAAYVYNLLKDKFYKTVIVISPSHAEYFPGISIYDGDAYETPLGIVEIDQVMTDKLVEDSKIIFRGIQGHRKEHALEVQIPFLQSVLNDFKIVPIVMGDQSKMFVDELAERIAKVVNDETLVVASSDMSHFYDAEEADRLDSVVEKRIIDFDFEQLLKDLDDKECEACGGGIIAVMMKAASLKNITKSVVLNRSDSGDVTGDKSEVVGYLSAVVYS
ncbi:MAG TPA: AmmeMemoRadiSam system protein B [Ignavibacteriaceae bacterium]|nr:AmmeMemoRadiSam system protein B [Ignavibacterium sp.]HRN25076.1 AmmeMemoRadiSam system protein B [Ignavibacteriaceae bacterium]HRP91771.1 AmmeMemoRadiSam system protein B [Ignavibacteriaceae bacterium]HRQ52893.1 AmmeMemoRadiSam system protein B [Ignavibacteriaceae bacterium]